MDFTNLLAAVNTLAMAYYFTGTATYAAHAAQLLEVWFLNPATMMNPNLNHAQIQLGYNTGSSSGLIDARNMYGLVDALGLLSSSSAWTTKDRAGMTAWMTQYNTWLQTSSFGKTEKAAPNNLGTWHDVQQMSILLYLGKTSDAKALAEAFGPRRIATEIKSDGSQPLELTRADGWTYSIFNLIAALETMANLSERVGVNLWDYQAKSGGSIRKALDYLAPYANLNTPFLHNHIGKTLSETDRSDLIPLLLQGQSVYGSYTKWLDMFPAKRFVAANGGVLVRRWVRTRAGHFAICTGRG